MKYLSLALRNTYLVIHFGDSLPETFAEWCIINGWCILEGMTGTVVIYRNKDKTNTKPTLNADELEILDHHDIINFRMRWQ